GAKSEQFVALSRPNPVSPKPHRGAICAATQAPQLTLREPAHSFRAQFGRLNGGGFSRPPRWRFVRSDAMAQITVENLGKIYPIAARDPGLAGAFRGLFRRRHREIVALDQVSFSLEKGELLGFIGPNGAGKSTTIKILSGILRPTSGRCTVGGLVP